MNLNFQVLNLFKNSIKFLGTTINLNFFFIQPCQLHTNKRYKHPLKKYINKKLLLLAPLDNLKNKLVRHNFINKNNKIIPKFIWLYRPIKEIIALYNSVIRGILNYYSFVDNWNNLINFILNTIQFSCAKLLAAKMKLKTCRRVFIKYGKPITFEGLSLCEPYLFKNKNFVKRFNLKNWQNVTPIITGLTANYKSIARLNKLSCEKCGSIHKVEMHHLINVWKI